MNVDARAPSLPFRQGDWGLMILLEPGYSTCGESVHAGWMGLDIGPDAIKQFQGALSDAKVKSWTEPFCCCGCLLEVVTHVVLGILQRIDSRENCTA